METGDEYFKLMHLRTKDSNRDVLKKYGHTFGMLILLEDSLRENSRLTAQLGRKRLLFLSDNCRTFLGITPSSLAQNKKETDVEFYKEETEVVGVRIKRGEKSIDYLFSTEKPDEIKIKTDNGRKKAQDIIMATEINKRLENDLEFFAETLEKTISQLPNHN